MGFNSGFKGLSRRQIIFMRVLRSFTLYRNLNTAVVSYYMSPYSFSCPLEVIINKHTATPLFDTLFRASCLDHSFITPTKSHFTDKNIKTLFFSIVGPVSQSV